MESAGSQGRSGAAGRAIAQPDTFHDDTPEPTRCNDEDTLVIGGPTGPWIDEAPTLGGGEARPSDSAAPTAGFIPGYLILGTLGRGGMGVVYRAIQERLHRTVALKVIPADRRPGLVARFRREAYAVARLNHPNIVTAFDFGEAPGHLFLALEYVQGLDCARAVRETGALEPLAAVAVAREAALGLAHAHDADVIHRDVKPANIMLVAAQTHTESRTLAGLVKVTDLGLAHVRLDPDAEGNGPAIPGRGVVVGTPSYMAPEQVSGLDVDHRTDIWSLGATLYFLLTARKPFAGADGFEILERRRCGERITHPDDLPGLPLPADVLALLEWLLAVDPDDRPDDWATVVGCFDRLLAGHRPVVPRLPEGTSSLARPERMPRRVLRSLGRLLRRGAGN